MHFHSLSFLYICTSLACHYLKGCINVGALVFFVLISRIFAYNKNLPTKESLGPDGLIAVFCQMFREDLLSTLNLLYKIESEGPLLIHSIKPVLSCYQNQAKIQ